MQTGETLHNFKVTVIAALVQKYTHSRICTDTHTIESLLFQAAVQASYGLSNFLSQSCLSLCIIIAQEYHAHSSVATDINEFLLLKPCF